MLTCSPRDRRGWPSRRSRRRRPGRRVRSGRRPSAVSRVAPPVLSRAQIVPSSTALSTWSSACCSSPSDEHCETESTTSRSARRRISGSSSCLPAPSDPDRGDVRARREHVGVHQRLSGCRARDHDVSPLDGRLHGVRRRRLVTDGPSIVRRSAAVVSALARLLPQTRTSEKPGRTLRQRVDLLPGLPARADHGNAADCFGRQMLGSDPACCAGTQVGDVATVEEERRRRAVGRRRRPSPGRRWRPGRPRRSRWRP